MSSPDGSEQSSMEDILASIRKIIATEPASETQPPASAATAAKSNGLMRNGTALSIGTELPRNGRDDESRTKFFTPLPERASPLFRRPPESDPAQPETVQTKTGAVEHDLADLLEDFGAAPETAESDTAPVKAEAVAEKPEERSDDTVIDVKRTAREPAPDAATAGEAAPDAAERTGNNDIDFSVLAAAAAQKPATPVAAEASPPAPADDPALSPAAAIGRAIADGNDFFELPPWAMAAAGARQPIDGEPVTPSIVPSLPQPPDGESDPLAAAIARVASAISPSDQTTYDETTYDQPIKAEVAPPQPPSPDPEPPVVAAEADTAAAANSALSELAAGLAASSIRTAEPQREPEREPLPPSVAPALPPAGPIPLVAPEAVFESAVSALVKPMLEKWLEDNMPRIIESALRAEVGETAPPPKRRT